MAPDIQARLLASIEAGRLVVICGAGLSMAAPSNLPSARRVAEICFDKYRDSVDPNVDPALRRNLEELAEHFAAQGTLATYFLRQLVPWTEFIKPSNAGHSAVADFLITRAAVASLSSNYDILIERQAWAFAAVALHFLEMKKLGSIPAEIKEPGENSWFSRPVKEAGKHFIQHIDCALGQPD